MNMLTTKDNEQRTFELLEKFFQKENLVYYKRESENIVIFLLPYIVTDEKLKVKIKLTTRKGVNFCIMGFKAKIDVNCGFDYQKELLDMNSSVVSGSYFIESDSNYIGFNTDFFIDETTDLQKTFSNRLLICIAMFLKLHDKKMIIVETVETEDNE